MTNKKDFQIISGGTFRQKIPLSECESFHKLYNSAQWIGSGNRRIQAQISFDETDLKMLIQNTMSMKIGDYDYKILGYSESGDIVVIKYGRIRVVG